jgi:CBS domain-containing protein
MLTRIEEVLSGKPLTGIVWAGPEMTAHEAARVMAERDIGAVLVLDEERLVGIFTERDLMVRVVGAGRDPAATPLAEVMTPDPVCIDADMSIQQGMNEIAARRIRHLPVVRDGRLVGLVSVRDLARGLIANQRERIDAINRAARALARHPLFWGASPVRGA